MTLKHPTITIGSPTNGVTLTVSRRTHDGAGDYWDGNWLSTEIRVAVGGFRARVDADLRAEEFESFGNQVRQLQEGSSDKAEFQTMEGWFSVLFSAVDRVGHIGCTGVLLDQPGIGNRLHFTLSLDQSYLPQLLTEIDEVVERFPIVGGK